MPLISVVVILILYRCLLVEALCLALDNPLICGKFNLLALHPARKVISAKNPGLKIGVFYYQSK